MNPIVRQMSASMALDEFGERLQQDAAFPIIVIGKLQVDGVAGYKLYSFGEASVELVGRTMLHVLASVISKEEFQELLVEWGAK